MKPSRYNYFFLIDDQIILGYNTLTTALAEMSAQEFDALQEFWAVPASRANYLPELLPVASAQSGLAARPTSPKYRSGG